MPNKVENVVESTILKDEEIVTSNEFLPKEGVGKTMSIGECDALLTADNDPSYFDLLFPEPIVPERSQLDGEVPTDKSTGGIFPVLNRLPAAPLEEPKP